MSESLREALIERNIVSTMVTMDDGHPSVVIHGRDDAADIALEVFADWLDRRAKALVSGEAESVVVQSVRFVKASALEKARDEIRQELRHV